MAYERTNWQNGDVISSEKLNKMEAGIEYACSLEHEVEDPTEGQVLKYDAEKEKFVNADAAIETNIQNPTDGQTLKYDAASGKWVNGEGGSGTLVVNDNSGTLDQTWQEIHDAFPNVIVKSTDSSDETQHFLYPVDKLQINDSEYIVNIYGVDYEASSPNDYPTSNNTEVH